MKVLVTGSNGFLGSHLIRYLCSSGTDNVVCMLRKNSNTQWLPEKGFQTIIGDLRDCGNLKEALKSVDIIYHLGGLVRAKHKSDLYEVNGAGTKNLAEAARKYATVLKKFVYVSSQSAWGPLGMGPVSDYGRSKKQGEEAVKKLPIYSIVRPGVVYGPQDKDFFEVFKAASRGVFVKPLKGGKLSFVHVKDCVRAIVESRAREVFVSDGKSYEWDEIKNTLQKVVGRKIFSIPIPEIFILWAGIASSAAGRLGGKCLKFNYDKAREILGGDWVMPSPEIKAEYGLEEGFLNTWRWYKRNKWI